jgi:hypothetical protein
MVGNGFTCLTCSVASRNLKIALLSAFVLDVEVALGFRELNLKLYSGQKQRGHVA